MGRRRAFPGAGRNRFEIAAGAEEMHHRVVQRAHRPEKYAQARSTDGDSIFRSGVFTARSASSEAAPALQQAILAGATVFSILALFVGLHWRDAIILPGGNFSILWFAVFIVAPLAWLTSAIYQLSRVRSRRPFYG